MINVDALKVLAAKLLGGDAADIPGSTNAEVIEYLAENFTGGSGGAVPEIPSGPALLTGEKAAAVTLLDESAGTEMIVETINELISVLQDRGITA